MNCRRQRLGLWLVVLLLPATALANAGTGMLLFRAVHLLYGNAIIGIGEGLLIALLLRLSLLRTIPVIIAANYASAWVGLYVLAFLSERIPFTLENTQPWVLALTLFTFVLTLLVEGPFFVWWMWGRMRGRWGAGATFIGVQAVSYVLMFALYAALSPQSLFRDHTWVQLGSMELPADVRLYYIAADDGDAYTCLPMGGEAAKVADLDCATVEDRLLVRPSRTGAGRHDLVLHRWKMDQQEAELVKPNVATIAAPDRRGSYPGNPNFPTNSWSFGPAPKLGDAEHSEWRWDVGYWAGEGLHGYRERDGAKVRYAYETPFVEWIIRNTTHLPGDLLLFQVGDEDICIADPARRVIARVCKGRSPVAVMAEE